MNWHEILQSMSSLSPTERLGWALLHSLWQGTAIALLLATVLLFMRRSSAARRYAVSCAALLFMAAFPIGTAALLLSVPPELSERSRPEPWRGGLLAPGGRCSSTVA